MSAEHTLLALYGLEKGESRLKASIMELWKAAKYLRQQFGRQFVAFSNGSWQIRTPRLRTSWHVLTCNDFGVIEKCCLLSEL